MSMYSPEKAGTIVPFAPTPKGPQDGNPTADESGRSIVALLQKAADMAKEDCARAMDLGTQALVPASRFRGTIERDRGGGRPLPRSRLAGRGVADPHSQRGRANVLSEEGTGRAPCPAAMSCRRPRHLVALKQRAVMPRLRLLRSGAARYLLRPRLLHAEQIGGCARAHLALACLALSVTPAAAMVGGAPTADQAIARHVVLIVGGLNLARGSRLHPISCSRPRIACSSNGKYRLVAFEGRRPVVKEVASVAPHPQFSPRADAPDLALVKLAATAGAKSHACAVQRAARAAVGRRPVHRRGLRRRGARRPQDRRQAARGRRWWRPTGRTRSSSAWSIRRSSAKAPASASATAIPAGRYSTSATAPWSASSAGPDVPTASRFAVSSAASYRLRATATGSSRRRQDWDRRWSHDPRRGRPRLRAGCRAPRRGHGRRRAARERRRGPRRRHADRLARHVLLRASRLRAISCSRPRIACCRAPTTSWSNSMPRGSRRSRTSHAYARHPEFDANAALRHRVTADVALAQARRAAEDRSRAACAGRRQPSPPATVSSSLATASPCAATARPAARCAPRRWSPPASRARCKSGSPIPPPRASAPGSAPAPAIPARRYIRDIGGTLAVVGVVSWSTGPALSDGCGGLTGVTPLTRYRGVDRGAGGQDGLAASPILARIIARTGASAG